MVDNRKYGLNVSCGDVDGDGVDEIIVGTGPDPKGKAIVRILKSDGTFVREVIAFDKKYRYGVNVGFVKSDDSTEPRIVTGLGPGPGYPSVLRLFSLEGELLGEHTIYPGLGKGLKISTGRTGDKE